MSLSDHGLQRWPGNLPGAVGEFNRACRRGRAPRTVVALSLAVLSAACSNAVREVPRDGALDYPEYMRVPSRAPSAEETGDSAPVLAWRARAGRGSLGPVALGDRVAVVATV